jgi:PAS domain S-box-containing protein
MHDDGESFRALADLADIGMATVDAATGQFLTVNLRYCAIVGLSAADLLSGLTLADLAHPDDEALAAQAIIRMAASTSDIYEIELRKVRPDGSQGWVRMRGRALPADGGQPRVAIVVHDLAAQKNVEDLLRQTRARQDDAEASQRESEGHYRALFEAMDEGFGVFEVMFDDQQHAVDMRCIETNPSYERQGGRSQAGGQTVRQLSPDAEPIWFEIYGKVALTGEPRRFTQWSRPRNMWFDVYAFRIGRAERRRIGVLFQNVTERKQVEAALREKEERQEFLLELSDALRPLTDPVAVQAEASRVLAEHLRLGRALYCEVKARTGDFGVRVREQLSAGHTVAVADVDTDPRLTASERNAIRTTGIQAFVAAPLVKNGRHVALFAVHSVTPRDWTAHDLSLIHEAAERTWSAVERAKAEEAFRVSDERLQMALEAADMGTFVWHVQRDETEPDERMLGLFGLPPGGRLNLTVALEKLIHPADRAHYAAAVAAAIDPDGNGTLREDVRVIHSDGSLHWLAITAQAVFEGDPPSAVRLVGMAADISEHKFTEAALRLSEEQLLESDRRKDEFLAVLAHELRNPLAPIRTGLELIRLGSDSRDAVERVRRMMERQIGQMVRLVDDLLDVSRITSGKIQLQRGARQLASLVQSALEANRAALQEARLELSVDVPEKPIWLDVDATRFVQVLSNILHNAVKFTNPGGRVALVAHVVGDAGRRDGELVLSVADSGVGIPSDMLPRVFDLFVQGQSAVDRPHSGLGIGLALARRLMDLHGGSIQASSDGPGRGSTFTVRMPIARDPSLDDDTADGRNRRTMISSRVLVIDDNVDAADTTAMLVEALGGSVAVAYGGEAGIAQAVAFRPRVVLLDLGMPGIDGYETCRRMRQALGAQVFIVALTGWGQEQDKDEALRAGFDAHLTKPADPAALEQLLEAAEPRGTSPDHSSVLGSS